MKNKNFIIGHGKNWETGMKTHLSSLAILVFSTFFFSLFTFTSCSSDQDESGKEQDVVTLPLEISLKPEMDMPLQNEDGTTRSLGDPGTYEHFELPKYAYVFIVTFTAENVAGSVLELDGGGNRLDLSPSQWQKGLAFESTIPQTQYDSVYTYGYTTSFSVLGLTAAKVYIAASNRPLKKKVGAVWKEIGKTGDDGYILSTSDTEADVLNLTFDIYDDFKNDIQNLYATPYNYYATDNFIGKVGTASSGVYPIRLYHVASKVDVKWNVAPEQQGNYCISYIQAQKLKQYNCLLFRPMENTWTTSGDNNDEDNNYDRLLMSGDIGQQWYGRQYFYTIPHKVAGIFNVNYSITKTGLGGNSGTRDIDYTYPCDLSAARYSIFVPWVRTDLDFTSGY